ncbi:EamA family transporter [Phyllobacterium phragmitis]|uniref:EamA family transporter n=2 Tax=Phyllobacterium phragmitis TaxID=2670329 RepID=A0A2S9IZT0_9HYPH|nr:DMT family transporter [Phyllobacterium phragmitis]PRD46000.1 EamA family transporter [Phyllobacterium phragmitis]
MMGIGFKVASVCVFVAMSSLLKASEGIPLGQLIFFRSFFAIFPVIIYLTFTHQLSGVFHTKERLSHVWRGLIGVSAMSFSFFALTRLPLPEAIAINYASPLFVVVFSAILLHETVRIYRWSAVVIGLVGVMVILWPRLSVFSSGQLGMDETLGALSALTGAVLSAIAMLLVRRLVQTERTPTIVIYFSLTSTIIGLLTLPFGWVMPTPAQALMLIGAGFAGGIAQIFLTQCYRYAEMSTIAPFEYTSMLLGLAIGYLVFGDVPTMQMIIGGTVVIGAGIFIIYREHRLVVAERNRRALALRD